MPTQNSSFMPRINPLKRESKSQQKMSSKVKWTLLIAIVILLYLIVSYTPLNPYLLLKYPTSKWQAVFLNNNQVYFGKIIKMNRKELTLKNIYYLQTVTAPLQRSQQVGGQPQVPEQTLTLVKLGNELHGPEDKMEINKDFIILIENLKTESQVVEAIDRYLKDQAGS